ncbi:MAG: DUF1049 domain-containing protein [Isosphaerales bacterium]
MPYEYKRRKPSIIRNFWVYRRLIGTAILLGMMLWFIWANSEVVTVAFPFGLGKLKSTLGVVMLLTALVSSVATILVTTIIIAVKRVRRAQTSHDQPTSQDQPKPTNLPADRPPPDYAAKTMEGFSNADWSN